MLTELFAAGQRHAPVPSNAFMERLVADAERVQPRPAAAGRDFFEPLWARLTAALGGWQGFGGLATATVAGLWIGYAGLADPNALTGGLLGADDAVELLPSTDYFALAEGME
ncbi:MAG: dihydroorotate dehydrogenase [Albidovulum sp.]|uniref:dihydroorotate dehydrogenase n=1 Tax=Albidovulum sp. TaxID=1872424 RepID=UPI003CBAAD0B